MTLLAMQRDMRAWLVREDGAAAARLGGPRGLLVYQNNYRSQLVACLSDSFACTRAWIGDAPFEAAAATHIDRVPPSSWTLDAYSRDFPATLALLWPHDPDVAELAWLECALGEAFVGADAPVLVPADIARIDWDRVRLRFSPTLDLGTLTTNAPAIWSALAAGETPPASQRLSESGAVMVWRSGHVSCFRAIDQVEHQAVLWARAGMPFGELCGRLVERDGEADGIARAGALLGQWVAGGLIAAAVEMPG